MQDGKTWLKRHDQDGTVQISKMPTKKNKIISKFDNQVYISMITDPIAYV